MWARICRACLAMATFGAGCASFNGVIETPDLSKLEVRGGGPVNALLIVAPPEIEDRDADHDFTPISAEFSRTLRENTIDFARAKQVFREVQQDPAPGAFVLKTKVVVTNYRKGRGLAVAILGSFLAPPLLGMAWAVPVGAGNFQTDISWALVNPEGKKRDLTNCTNDIEARFADHYSHVISECLGRALDWVATEATPEAPALIAPTVAKVESAPKVLPAVNSSLRGVIVAVFDIDDPSKSFNASSLGQLADYLAARLSEVSGAKVVPRDQLRARLKQEKQDTYQPCYDQGCQIELGKAIAAQKTLSTKIIKVANRCAVTSVLYDLRTETADQAATVQSDCAESKLMDALEQVLARLTGTGSK